MEWNYYDTFILVAADCPAEFGMAPLSRKGGKTKPELEYELIANDPYGYTQEELLYQVHIRHKGIQEAEETARNAELREEFLRKPQPCMRASMLPKKYGWGLHFNGEGKVALVPRESADYQIFAEGRNPNVRLLAAMRNSRSKG